MTHKPVANQSQNEELTKDKQMLRNEPTGIAVYLLEFEVGSTRRTAPFHRFLKGKNWQIVHQKDWQETYLPRSDFSQRKAHQLLKIYNTYNTVFPQQIITLFSWTGDDKEYQSFNQ